MNEQRKFHVYIHTYIHLYVYTHTMEHYSDIENIQKNEVLSFVATWMEVEILSEKSQSQKYKYKFSFIYMGG